MKLFLFAWLIVSFLFGLLLRNGEAAIFCSVLILILMQIIVGYIDEKKREIIEAITGRTDGESDPIGAPEPGRRIHGMTEPTKEE